MEFTIKQVCQSTGAKLVFGDADSLVSSCAIDSREVEPGGLFVAVVGERVDGNDFCMSAIENGAACVSLTRDPTAEELACAEEHGAAILFDRMRDPEAFLLSLASAYRELIRNTVIVAVTGSVGKTTTKEMLSAALSRMYSVHATKGNLNSFFGVALTLLSAPETTQVIVMEMGMNKRGEIFRETRSARPNLAVITNIGTAHVGMLGSRREIAEAKSEVFFGMESTPFVPGGGMRLIMPHEDDFFDIVAELNAPRSNVEPLTAGMSPLNSIHPADLALDGEGKAVFDVVYADGERIPAKLSIPGIHAVSDAMLALAVADLMRVPRAAAVEAVGATKPYRMRLQTTRIEGGPTIIDDSYNASPASMAAAIDVLCAFDCEGRRIAVLGEMGELGDDERLLHASVGAYTAAKDVDMLVTIGSGLASDIRGGASACGMSSDSMESFPDVESAIAVMGDVLAEGDVVLVKASRSAGLDAFVKGLIER